VCAAHGQVIGADNIFFTKSAVLAIDPYSIPIRQKNGGYSTPTTSGRTIFAHEPGQYRRSASNGH
jgi:hypothetical protein